MANISSLPLIKQQNNLALAQHAHYLAFAGAETYAISFQFGTDGATIIFIH
jgi:hypothetical protein